MKHLSTCIALTVIYLSLPLQHIVADTQINQRTSQDQKDCDIAAINEQGFIAVWDSYLHDSESGAIVARFIDTNGIPTGDEFIVNQITAGNQSEPTVAVSDANTILIAWRSESIDANDDIAGRLFNRQGEPISNEFIINQHTDGSQHLPRAIACPNDTFAITWETDSLPDDKDKAISLRILDIEGLPITDEINASDTPQYNTRYANLASDTNGNLAITWLEDRTSDAVKLRWFNHDGIAQGPSEKVNTETFKSLTWPDLAISPENTLIITWDGHPQKSSQDNIHARIYDPNGQPQGDAFIINTQQTGGQKNPTITINNNQTFTITWDSDTGGTQKDIWARTFTTAGLPTTEETIINQHQTDNQEKPNIATTNNGNHLITWQSKNQDGSGWGIYTQTNTTTAETTH